MYWVLVNSFSFSVLHLRVEIPTAGSRFPPQPSFRALCGLRVRSLGPGRSPNRLRGQQGQLRLRPQPLARPASGVTGLPGVTVRRRGHQDQLTR